jgi:hypothetical protein
VRAIARAVLMVQREFAERVVAGAGSKIYGRLSVMVQQQAAVEILFHVPAGAFHPRPAVTSTVFRLVPRARPRSPRSRTTPCSRRWCGRPSPTRRKMLRRALAPPSARRRRVPCHRRDIDETRRAEELDVPPSRAWRTHFSRRGRVPELPEVETIVRSLRPAPGGRAHPGGVDQRAAAAAGAAARRRRFCAHLPGRSIVAVKRRGKYILMETAPDAACWCTWGCRGGCGCRRRRTTREPHPRGLDPGR